VNEPHHEGLAFHLGDALFTLAMLWLA
jgi:hypothetical protein